MMRQNQIKINKIKRLKVSDGSRSCPIPKNIPRALKPGCVTSVKIE